MQSYADLSGMPMRGSPPHTGYALEESSVATPSSTGQKRKRTSQSELVSDQEDHDENHGPERARHVPKRACNECRQQKVNIRCIALWECD